MDQKLWNENGKGDAKSKQIRPQARGRAGTNARPARAVVAPDRRCWGITEHAGRQDHRDRIDWTSVDDVLVVQPGPEVVWWKSSRPGGGCCVALQYCIASLAGLSYRKSLELSRSRPPRGEAAGQPQTRPRRARPDASIHSTGMKPSISKYPEHPRQVLQNKKKKNLRGGRLWTKTTTQLCSFILTLPKKKWKTLQGAHRAASPLTSCPACVALSCWKLELSEGNLHARTLQGLLIYLSEDKNS